MKLRFPKLAAALAEYDRTAPERAEFWDDAKTIADMHRAEAADKAAREAVGRAFNVDKLNPHSLEHNLRINIQAARAWAKLTLR